MLNTRCLAGQVVGAVLQYLLILMVDNDFQVSVLKSFNPEKILKTLEKKDEYARVHFPVFIWILLQKQVQKIELDYLADALSETYSILISILSNPDKYAQNLYRLKYDRY